MPFASAYPLDVFSNKETCCNTVVVKVSSRKEECIGNGSVSLGPCCIGTVKDKLLKEYFLIGITLRNLLNAVNIEPVLTKRNLLIGNVEYNILVTVDPDLITGSGKLIFCLTV